MNRVILLVLLGVVAGTAILAGVLMVLGSWFGSESLGIPAEAAPPLGLLAGSPFRTYLVPGLLLALVVGGTQLWGFLLTLRRSRWAGFATAVAGTGILVWIFVQAAFIPFSVLQALYFAFGIAELGFLLLSLGLIPHRRPADNAAGPSPAHQPERAAGLRNGRRRS